MTRVGALGLALLVGCGGEVAPVEEADAPFGGAPAGDEPAPILDAPAPAGDEPAPILDAPAPADAGLDGDAGAPPDAPAADLGFDAPSPPRDAPAPPRDVPAPPADVPRPVDACSFGPPAGPERMMIGLADSNENMFTNPGFDRFFVSSRGVARRRIAHVYTHWNVALQPPTHVDRVKLQTWLDRAACHGVEALVAFTPVRGARLPVPAEYDQAFLRFRATWPQVHAFTAWNEPNGPDSWPDSARTAADIYLRARSRCDPARGCIVAAGDMAATVAGRTVDFRMATGPDSPCGRATCSWLDRYKYSIDADGRNYGLPRHRPAYWAVHNWADAFHYERNGNHCNDNPATCVTAAFAASIRGSWGRAEIWMTEVGGVLDGRDAATQLRNQHCAGRFFQRLFATDPRVTRWYYYSFAGVGATGDSGVCPFLRFDRGACTTASGAATRPIYDVLRDRISASAPGCP